MGRGTVVAAACVAALLAACGDSEIHTVDARPEPGVDAAETDCPEPEPGTVTICGQLVDTETNDPVAGPAVSVRFYEAIQWFQDPDAPELAATLEISGAGRLVAAGLPAPTTGYVTLAVDDANAADDYVRTAMMLTVATGQRLELARIYATRRSTDERWTTSAGDPFADQTFSDVGAGLLLFLHDQMPRADVTVTFDGLPDPEADDYFDDTDAWNRASLASSQPATGPNGAALVTSIGLGQPSAIGGSLPPGCEWPEPLVGVPPGSITVHELHSVTETTGASCTP